MPKQNAKRRQPLTEHSELQVRSLDLCLYFGSFIISLFFCLY